MIFAPRATCDCGWPLPKQYVVSFDRGVSAVSRVALEAARVRLICPACGAMHEVSVQGPLGGEGRPA